MAKKLAAILLALMLVVSIVGCGGSSASTASQAPKTAPLAYDSASMEELGFSAAPQEAEFNAKPSTGGGVQTSDRKIVKNAHVIMETKAFDDDLAKIFETITAAGGYIDSHSINGPSIYRGSGGEKYASISARVPSDALDATTNALLTISNIISQSSSANDITDSYFDSEARLKSLTLQEERLLEILAKAEKLEDVISLEQALSNARYEIESLTAQLRRMDKEVSDSFLTIELREVVEYQHKERTFSDRLSASLSRSVTNVKYFLESMLFGIIELAPVILIVVAIGAIFVAVAMRYTRKRFRLRSDAPWYVAVKEKLNEDDDKPEIEQDRTEE